jgi:transposase, IS30 family
VQSRGALRKELTRYLRSGRSTPRRKGHSVMNGQGQLRGTLNIRERPAEAADRAVPGHWEGDLLFGTRMRAIATLVERTTCLPSLEKSHPDSPSSTFSPNRARSAICKQGSV